MNYWGRSGLTGSDPSKWDCRFLQLAKLISTWSKDPSTRVGSVIVRNDNTIASTGYNGFPRFVDDSPEALANRETKLMMTVHAEINAILHARERLQGYTLYVVPIIPCSNCAAAIIQAGLGRVVSVAPGIGWERWAVSFEIARGMFDQAGIHLDLLDCDAGEVKSDERK